MRDADMRPHRPLWFMKHAFLQAERSTCFRLNVGTVIVGQKSKKILSSGYNGPASGESHCEGHLCDGAKSGCTRAVHAEVNAVSSLRLQGEFLDVYCTHSPCVDCLIRLISHGRIIRIFYCHEYRMMEHLRDASSAMGVYRVTPAGYVTQFPTGQLMNPEGFYD